MVCVLGVGVALIMIIKNAFKIHLDEIIKAYGGIIKSAIDKINFLATSYNKI
ncbi:MAG: hypothetical protein LBR59_01285 [Endomicrobium sp.]|jgi:hypothetical protein|nr:hypothetical protein [Endomicrobium sp.]